MPLYEANAYKKFSKQWHTIPIYPNMPPIITSLQNPRVKKAARLRDRRGRELQGRIIIDGARELRRAIEAGIRPDEVFVCEELCTGEDARRVLGLLADLSADVVRVSQHVFSKIAFGERAEGVVGVAPAPQPTLADLKLRDAPLVAVLENVEKPGNLGAVLRSADGAAVDALVAADGGTDLFNPNAIRASLGTIFTLSVCAASSEETLAWLRKRKLTIFVARVDGAVGHTEADFTGPAAIVLGNEARGVSDVWRCDDTIGVKLPMLGTADSLNVSAAAAVFFYEALRQRSG